MVKTLEGTGGLDDFVSSASFWVPETLAESAWHQHAPFAFWLVGVLKPRLFVELGTHHGFSYLSLCQAAEQSGLDLKGYAIDTWQGDDHAGFYDNEVYAGLRDRHDLRYGSFSRLIRATFDEALPQFAEKSIDLLHIDGRHYYEDVKHDFDSWKSKLSDRAVVLFHDTNVRERGFGVFKLWDELRAQYPAFEFLHGHGLGVLGFGAELPEPLKRLCGAPADSALSARIQEMYARLGVAIEESFLLAKQGTALRQREEELTRLSEQARTTEPRLLKQAGQISELEDAAAKRLQVIDTLRSELAARSEAALEAERELASERGKLSGLERKTRSSRWLSRQLADKIVHAPRDTSRQTRRSLGKRVKHVKKQYADFSYQILRVLARQNWLFNQNRLLKFLKSAQKRRGTIVRNAHADIGTKGQVRFLDLGVEVHHLRQEPNIAIQMHIFYPELIPELKSHLSRMPFKFDLLVSIVDAKVEKYVRDELSNLRYMNNLVVKIVPNRGRDIAAFFVHFREEIRTYEVVAHIHTKKSLYTGSEKLDWRDHLLSNMFSSSESIDRIVWHLHDGDYGLIYPQTFHHLPYLANTWLANAHKGRDILSRLGFDAPVGFFDFPAGSMFWVKVAALEPLFDCDFSLNDFAEERGQLDGTLAHTVERLIGVTSKAGGFSIGVIPDERHSSWSRWRLDTNYIAVSSNFVAEILSKNRNLIIFDIFDTLLIRPVIDPDVVKRIVAQRAGAILGQKFVKHRAQVEAECRSSAGRDIDIHAIYKEINNKGLLTEDECQLLLNLEVDVEVSLCCPRQDAIELMRTAWRSGKRVVLASDMFLSIDTVSKLARDYFGECFSEIYLSSDIGLRKDTGLLYDYILRKEDISRDQVLMIGDNARSDWQIPGDMGIRVRHLISPVELAKGFPLYEPLVGKYMHANPDDQITLGLVINNNFGRLNIASYGANYFSNKNGADCGYSVLGPLLASFSAWLSSEIAATGTKRAFFLAREGRIIKEAYDIWTEGLPDVASSNYIVLSRRAVTVASIEDLSDILEIAKVPSYSNTAEKFLYVRYGLDPNNSEVTNARRELLPNDKIAVKNGDISVIIPLLTRLENIILAQAQKEKPGLIAYLAELGLINSDSKAALVDVGYSGTIQKYLCGLTRTHFDGYYMMTSAKAEEMSISAGVSVFAAFQKNADIVASTPSLFSQSFALEQLLSCDEPQICSYQINDAGIIERNFKELSAQELASFRLRSEIRQGALQYVRDAVSIREKTWSGFMPSRACAMDIFEQFIDQHNEDGMSLLEQLALDDDYCGRGIVVR